MIRLFIISLLIFSHTSFCGDSRFSNELSKFSQLILKTISNQLNTSTKNINVSIHAFNRDHYSSDYKEYDITVDGYIELTITVPEKHANHCKKFCSNIITPVISSYLKEGCKDIILGKANLKRHQSAYIYNEDSSDSSDSSYSFNEQNKNWLITTKKRKEDSEFNYYLKYSGIISKEYFFDLYPNEYIQDSSCPMDSQLYNYARTMKISPSVQSLLMLSKTEINSLITSKSQIDSFNIPKSLKLYLSR